MDDFDSAFQELQRKVNELADYAEWTGKQYAEKGTAERRIAYGEALEAYVEASRELGRLAQEWLALTTSVICEKWEHQQLASAETTVEA